jgi:transposase-like protein
MRKRRCIYCFSLSTKRFGTYAVGIRKKQYKKQRFLCLSCKRSFTVKQTQDVGESLQKHLVRDSLEGRSSMRVIGRREDLSKNTVSLAITTICKQTRDSIWIAKKFQPKWGNVLSVDGKIIRVFDPFAKGYIGTRAEKKYLLKKVWFCGVDVSTKDLPHYKVIDGETKIDLFDYFTTLKKEIVYDLKVCVCDGNPETMETVHMVYGLSIGIQLCVRHFIEALKRITKEEKQTKRQETEQLVMNIWGALEARTEADCFSALKALSSIEETRCQKMIQQSLSRQVFLLTTHFRYQKQFFVPRYNNDAENLFRQVNLRLKSWNIFRNKTNAEHYLKTWALMRRFTKFTDCKGGLNKLKNGHAPLELAGVDLTNIDYLKIK